MTDLAERTRDSTVVAPTTGTYTPRDAPPVPPSIHVPPDTPAAPSPSWPPSAKAWVAILAVAGLLLAAVAVIGYTTGNDSSATERELQTQVESITTERDALAVEVAAFQATIDTTVAARDDLVAQVADLQATIDTTVAERDTLVSQLNALESRTGTLTVLRDHLVAQIDGLDATIATLTTQRDDLAIQLDSVEASLVVQTNRTAAAIAERDALAAVFPFTVDPSLDIAKAVGTYDLSTKQAYCDGLGSCGTLPMIDEMTIRETADHRLELVMPGYPAAGLLRLDGVLYAVLDVSNASTACGTEPRLANVTVTVFAAGLTTAADGTQTITDLAASMTMHAPATPTCDAGTAVYALQLTPQA